MCVCVCVYDSVSVNIQKKQASVCGWLYCGYGGQWQWAFEILHAMYWIVLAALLFWMFHERHDTLALSGAKQGASMHQKFELHD